VSAPTPFLRIFVAFIALVAAIASNSTRPVSASDGARSSRPDAIIDLRRSDGVALAGGEWRYHDARIVEVAHREPGPDRRPSGRPNRTRDIDPKAGEREFDDSAWVAVRPEDLEERRSSGRLSFGWYRIRVTLPERVAGFDVAGSSVWLEVVVDDYAEVWIDGELPLVLGSTSGRTVSGWNVANRVLLTRKARPGASFQIAVFAANAPLSSPPENYVWIRSATLDLYRPDRFPVAESFETVIDRIDPAVDALVSPGAKMERLAKGFEFTEGPVWVPDGFLLFSDPNANTIYRWSEEAGAIPFRTKSGYTGFDIGEYSQPGSNGLALDADGRLIICEHGNRRVTRLEKNGTLTVLADRFEGKRLNSPNDLVHRSDGALFFTDPPFGLPKVHDDSRRELSFSGVFCLIDGELRVVSKDLEGPNGLAFSPDGRYLYVANWDTTKKTVTRYAIAANGSAESATTFFDMGDARESEALDGLKVDSLGNLWVSGPGGIWIISPEAKHLGTLRGPELPANFAWGDADRKALYLTARTGLYRIRLDVAGSGFSSRRSAP
jgi:gluconolactonase